MAEAVSVIPFFNVFQETRQLDNLGLHGSNTSLLDSADRFYIVSQPRLGLPRNLRIGTLKLVKLE